QRGQEHRCKNGDDGNDDEQFDKRKRMRLSPASCRFARSRFDIHVFRILTYFRIIRKNPEPLAAGMTMTLVAVEPGTSCQLVVRPTPGALVWPCNVQPV